MGYLTGMRGVGYGMLDTYGMSLLAKFKNTLGDEFHWFGWHFQTFAEDHGGDNENVKSMAKGFVLRIVAACREVEKVVPGFGMEFIGRLASIRSKTKNIAQYEQLLQLLAELYVLRRVTTFEWTQPVTFEYEPPSALSKKNPEIIVRCENFSLGVEVKCPAILNHIKMRGQKHVQAVGRSVPLDTLEELGGGDVMRPRDNPIKDFLTSADVKFHGHQTPGFFGVLFVFWDEFLNEPISALVNPASGLLTPNSFHKVDGVAVGYRHVDGVVLVPAFHLLSYVTGHEEMNAVLDFLNYGDPHEEPYKAFVPVSKNFGDFPEEILECMGAAPHETLIGAEFQPTDMVLWVESRRGAPL